MIEITDDDIIAMVNAAVEFKCLNGAAMEAAVAVLLARHPEWQAQRPMHEPPTDAEVEAMRDAYRQCSDANWISKTAMKDAAQALLTGRAAPQPVVVTEEMRRECTKAIGWETGGASRAIWDAMNWMAKYINGEHEKPADPRVEILKTALEVRGYDATPDELAHIIAEMDEVKP